MIKWLGILLLLVSMDAMAEKKGRNVRYRKSKKINFEALLIEGQIKRPEISVVTGNVGEDVDGLLQLRVDFHDQMAVNAGEKIK